MLFDSSFSLVKCIRCQRLSSPFSCFYRQSSPRRGPNRTNNGGTDSTVSLPCTTTTTKILAKAPPHRTRVASNLVRPSRILFPSRKDNNKGNCNHNNPIMVHQRKRRHPPPMNSGLVLSRCGFEQLPPLQRSHVVGPHPPILPAGIADRQRPAAIVIVTKALVPDDQRTIKSIVNAWPVS